MRGESRVGLLSQEPPVSSRLVVLVPTPTIRKTPEPNTDTEVAPCLGSILYLGWVSLPHAILQHKAGGQGVAALIMAPVSGHQAGVRGEGKMAGSRARGGGEHGAGTQEGVIGGRGASKPSAGSCWCW